MKVLVIFGNQSVIKRKPEASLQSKHATPDRFDMRGSEMQREPHQSKLQPVLNSQQKYVLTNIKQCITS